jgi:predicted transcriptional regulator
MRFRSEFIAWAALAVTFALLMNQAPSLLSSPGSSPLGSDSSDNAATTDLSSTEAYTDFSSVPMGLILLSSEYLRKARESAADVLIFPRPPIAEPASRRDQLTIMVDILAFARKPASRKQIIRSLNMSQHQLKKYLRVLIQKGFLLEEQGQSRTYKVTEKGREFVRLLEC